MWNQITNEKDILAFMTMVGWFHDSCVKEMKYSSGAYVGDDLDMWPLNDKRVLNVVVQRQFEEMSMIEMQFTGLKYLKLFPLDEKYTCEILGSTMFFKDGCVYWCDCEDVSEDDFEDYKGTLICAEGLRWRTIENRMGAEEFYSSPE